MKRFSFPGEVLCLFFIITVVTFFGKILLDVKASFDAEIGALQKNNVVVDYDAYSHKDNARIETMKDVTIIKNMGDLNYFSNLLKETNVNVKWLTNKIGNYSEDYFQNKTLVVVSIINDDNVISTRINDVYRNDDDIIVEINKKIKDVKVNSKYTWFAIIELSDIYDTVKLDIIKN